MLSQRQKKKKNPGKLNPCGMVGVSELAHDDHFVVYLCLKMGFRPISATFILLTEHLGQERFQEEDTCEFEVAGRADAAFLH